MPLPLPPSLISSPSSKLWEVVRLQQSVQGLLPPPLVHQVIELRDFVTQGAPSVDLVTEGGATLHTACSLGVQLISTSLSGGVLQHLIPVLQAGSFRTVTQSSAVVLNETTTLQGGGGGEVRQIGQIREQT